MRRVAVTGLGIVSSLGNNAQEVTASLHDARSGIVRAEDYAALGFRSQVHGSLKIDLDETVDRRARRFMGDGAAFTGDQRAAFAQLVSRFDYEHNASCGIIYHLAAYWKARKLNLLKP